MKANYILITIHRGSAQLTGEAPGLQIRCGALKPSRVGSIPMHFRHFHFRPIVIKCGILYQLFII